MALTLTAADAVLKEFYLPGIRKQLNNDIPLLAQYEKNTRDVEGRRAVLSVHTARNSGVGARPEGGTLPTAGNQGTSEERIPMKYNYGRLQINGPVFAATKSDRGSFTRALDLETNGLMDDLKVDVHRQVWGTTSGKIATTGTTSSSTTVTLATSTTAVQMRQFDIGMVVTIGTAANVDSIAGTRTITAIDAAAKTITISGAAVSTTDGQEFVFRDGSVGDSVVYELTGLVSMVDSSGALFNITHDSWQSIENGNSGTNRTLTESLMAKVTHEVQIKGGKFPNLIVASDGVYRAFAGLQTSIKRFATLELKGGWTGLEFAAGTKPIPVTWDRFAPANKMFLLNTEHLIEFQSSDWDWMDRDGAVLSRVANTDAYEATLFKYHETATDKRNAHGRIDDLTEAA